MIEFNTVKQKIDLPLVSIVIPTYNRADLIAGTLTSALASDYQNIEVIVTDNASTDGTGEIVQKIADRDPRVKLFSQVKNLGPVLNWKMGLRYSNGDYIKILWSDDLMSPSFISLSMELFRQEPNLAFVFSEVEVGASPDSVNGVMYNSLPCTGIFQTADFVRGVYLGQSLPFSPGCAIFEAERLRASLVESNDLFANNYLKNGAGPDVLMFLMSCVGVDRFGFIGKPLSFFREHQSSITTSSKGLEIKKAYAKALIWYLWKYFGKQKAITYWMYMVKKMKLYLIWNHKEMRDFKMLSGETKYWYLKYPLLFLAALFMPSRKYLKVFESLEMPNVNT